MASLGHVAVGMAAARYRYGRRAGPSTRPALAHAAGMLGWSALSLLPDLDVVGFRFGVRYGDPWGHRGATHSFVFALGIGLVALLVTRKIQLAALVAAVVASHGLLDIFTDGGMGCALFWPFDTERYFAPWNPIPVAPIGRAFFSPRGLSVMTTELVLFAPLLLYGLLPRRHRAG